MMKTFRSYQLVKQLYLETKKTDLRGELKDQLHRAALSVCLNLSEGCDRGTTKDRRRFYTIALSSLREVQAVIDLEAIASLYAMADKLGAYLYNLVHAI